MVEKDEVVKALKEVIDPHTNQDVYDMGLIEDLEVKDDEISFVFRPSSPYCPLGVQLASSVKEKVKEVAGVDRVKIKVKGHVQEEQITEQLCD